MLPWFCDREVNGIAKENRVTLTYVLNPYVSRGTKATMLANVKRALMRNPYKKMGNVCRDASSRTDVRFDTNVVSVRFFIV